MVPAGASFSKPWAAFLSHFSEQIRAMPGEDVQLFFQKLPTAGWGEPEVEVLLSRAFVLSTLYPRINEPPRAPGS